GALTENDVDRAVSELLKLEERCVKGRDNIMKCSYFENAKLAQQIAENSMVLLKNENNILPLDKKDKVLFVGQLVETSRYQGGGSSNINTFRLDSMFGSLSDGHFNFDYLQGYKTNSSEVDEELERSVLNSVPHYENVVLVVGLPDSYESEGYDRLHMNLPPNQLHLIDEVCKIHKNVIIVLQCGSPVEMPFIGNIKGLLLSYLGGCSAGHATVNILYGLANPSGHLAETFPLRLEDNPIKTYPESNLNVYYREGQYIGYRYYEMAQKKVLFPFGYGLSYSSFAYEKCRFESNTNTIKLIVKNESFMDGAQVIQVYFMHRQNDRRYIELKAFEKVFLKTGESKEISFVLKNDFFTQYDAISRKFVEYTGEVEVLVGTSCRDFFFNFNHKHEGEMNYLLPEYEIKFDELKENRPNVKKHYTINSTPEDIRTCAFGRFLYKILMKIAKKFTKSNPDLAKAVESLAGESPLRFLVIASNGKFSMKQVEGLVDLLNGHFFKGLGKIL
ncbi:MAG: glycoside hydrolase family 3 C-terminal domain-containing protein, partial [Bacilli bacterium]|nr:glycoside hydrolase family 3 C-terminal domain-containing protein [Bacilli bacterium]